MNQEVKQQWINALRNGEYAQTQRTLKDVNGFCCLGVLCDLYTKATGNGKWTKPEYSEVSFLFETEGESHDQYIPNSVRDWAGLSNCNPRTDMEDPRTELAYKNDKGSSFKEIADMLERADTL